MYRVLIVEDEDIIRKGLIFLADWARLNCMVVGEATNGVEGIEKIAELNPDIVITDIKMPCKDGLEMLAETIEHAGYQAILLTGYADFEYARAALRLGVTEYLLKPLDFDQLYLTLQKITDKLEKLNHQRNVLGQAARQERAQELLPDINWGQSPHVLAMLAYIRTDYAMRISLTDISEELNLSCTYLNSKFKEETGFTFNDFLNRYRISQAVEILRKDGPHIYQVASQVGFSDYKYFTKVFKKYTGSSPVKFIHFG